MEGRRAPRAVSGEGPSFVSTSSVPFSSPVSQPETAADRTVPESPAAEHAHRSARSDERVWLERLPNQAATMGLHAFCVDCGSVRSRLPGAGRSAGFFHHAIGNLQTVLENHPKYGKLAQVHARLIGKALESIPDFGDPYSMSYGDQWAVFLRSVQRVRPDLPVDLIECVMPREPRRKRRPFIDKFEVSEKGVESPK